MNLFFKQIITIKNDFFFFNLETISNSDPPSISMNIHVFKNACEYK